MLDVCSIDRVPAICLHWIVNLTGFSKVLFQLDIALFASAVFMTFEAAALLDVSFGSGRRC